MQARKKRQSAQRRSARPDNREATQPPQSDRPAERGGWQAPGLGGPGSLIPQPGPRLRSPPQPFPRSAVDARRASLAPGQRCGARHHGGGRRRPYLLLLGVLRVDIGRPEPRALQRSLFITEKPEGGHDLSC
ncbi:hypothetical protein NN561_008475 [Cricetulus griseus]